MFSGYLPSDLCHESGGICLLSSVQTQIFGALILAIEPGCCAASMVAHPCCWWPSQHGQKHIFFVSCVPLFPRRLLLNPAFQADHWSQSLRNLKTLPFGNVPLTAAMATWAFA